MIKIFLLIPLLFIPIFLFAFDFKLEVEEIRTFPVDGITKINAFSINGKVAIEATEGTEIIVKITRSCLGEDENDAQKYIGNVTVKDTIVEGTLILKAKTPKTDVRNYTTQIEIKAPGSIYPILSTINGGITIENMTAGGEGSSTNGGITFESCVGKVIGLAENGRITATDHSGSIDVKTSNGLIECNVLTLKKDESVNLKTTNGGIKLYLPAGISASIDAKTTNGKVTINGFTNIDYVVNKPTHKKAKVGDGDTSIHVETTNGMVSIKGK